MSVLARFESKFERITECGCWIWTAGIFKARGYGAFAHPEQLAHRVSWALYRGSIPAGAHVLHSCDVPACVNPDHLFLGNQQANMADKVSKDRQSRGQGTGVAKLTEQQVVSILVDQRQHKAIAAEHGVSSSTVSEIKLRKTWKHIDAPADFRYQRKPGGRKPR